MSEYELFGLRITCTGDPVAVLPLESLFGAAPRANEETTALLRGACDLAAHATCASGSPDTEGYRPAFFHGRMRGLQRAGRFLLIDGDSHVRVSAEGRTLEVVTGPGSDVSFSRITVFIGLTIALRHHGLYHLHAGAVEDEGRVCVLVMGTSGAGKSTLTLAMAAAGGDRARVLGDDALFLDGRTRGANLVGFPRPFHVGPATLAAFPGLESGNPDAGGKRPVTLDSVPGRSVSRLGPPHLVLFPQVTDDPITEASPLSRDETFGRALHSAALVAVDGMPLAAQHLRLLGRLLESARAYEVRLGKDLLSHPVQVAGRLFELGR